jgi:AraC-like DNA-binding protein
LRDPRWRYRKIADIAAEAGFSDLSSFNRAFRRRFGLTPSVMREEHKAGHHTPKASIGAANGVIEAVIWSLAVSLS